MPTVGIGGRDLFYERSGTGEAMLLVQGMGGTHFAWGEEFLAPLRERFEVVVFDNRGIGNSGTVAEGFSVAELAADAVGLLDALEIGTAHVGGISMGGMIAQELALSAPGRVRSLMLGCTYCGGEGSELMGREDFAKLGAAYATGNEDEVLRASWEVNLSSGFRADESRYPAFAAMASAAPVPRATVELQLQAILAHDTNSRLPELQPRTLVIHGSEDRVLPLANGRLIASLIPGSTLEILDGVGHMFWWERPAEAATLLTAHALGPG